MILYALLIDLILIAVGIFAHKKWDNSSLGSIIFIAGGFLLMVDVLTWAVNTFR